MIVGSSITHHANRLDGEQHGECLPDLVVQPRRTDLLQVNRVHPAQQVEPLFIHGSEDANGQPGTREWVPPHDVIGQPKLPPDLTHFVLEQLPQRLDELPRHVGPQPADIVMGFDRRRWAAFGRG